MPNLNEEDQVRLDSCMDEIRNVVGDTASERQLVETIMNCNYDCVRALDAILNQTTSQTSPPTSGSSASALTASTKEPMETGKKQQQHFLNFRLKQICFNLGFLLVLCAFCIPYVLVCRVCLFLHAKYFRYA